MTKIILLGGFLGSGKTTLMVAAAKLLEKEGHKTAVITNDQGDTLVDTVYSRMEGLSAHEVAGGCFCCRFPDFLDTVKKIIDQENPEYIIAEAVGSCTDLAATVISPLKTFYKDTVEVLGFLTLVDGERMVTEYKELNLKNPVEPGEVLVSHQIRESEVLVVSKTDLLTPVEAENSVEAVRFLNPRGEIFMCSARTGEGLTQLLKRVRMGFPLDFTERIPLDYEVYARAEAEYGWYNGSWMLDSQEEIDPMDLSFELMGSFDTPSLGHVAHAKLFILTPRGALKVSYVSGRIQADEITLTDQTSRQVKVYLNVRSACTPQAIEDHVQFLHKILEKKGYRIDEYERNSLIPSPPDPYYR